MTPPNHNWLCFVAALGAAVTCFVLAFWSRPRKRRTDKRQHQIAKREAWAKILRRMK